MIPRANFGIPDLPASSLHQDESEFPGILEAAGYSLPSPDRKWRKSIADLAEAQIRFNRPSDAIPNLMMLYRSDASDLGAARLLALALAKSNEWERAQVILDNIAGQKSPVSTPLTRHWSRLKRIAFIMIKLTDAAFRYGTAKLLNPKDRRSTHSLKSGAGRET